MFENPRRGRQARNFTTCSENSRSQIVFRTDILQKLTLGAPEVWSSANTKDSMSNENSVQSSSFAVLLQQKVEPSMLLFTSKQSLLRNIFFWRGYMLLVQFLFFSFFFFFKNKVSRYSYYDQFTYNTSINNWIQLQVIKLVLLCRCALKTRWLSNRGILTRTKFRQ